MAKLVPRHEAGLMERTGIALYTRSPADTDEFIVHYDGGKTPKTEAEELELLQAYDRYHASKGWGGIGYNMAVGPVTGRVYEARGLDRVGAHTTGHNTRGIGVVLIGGEDALTDAAKRGLKDAYSIATDWSSNPLVVSGHQDHAPTSCPGRKTYDWIKAGGITEKGTDMSKKPITRQGLLVAPGTYAAYERMRTAFKAATDYDLLLTSAYRSYAQQKDLYDRWTGRPGGPIKKPPFYSPSVAKPGTSRHETGRALDLRDSGNSPGVTVAGNKRSNWIKANASKYGFSANGYGFGEPWHVEYQGDPWAGGGSTGGATAKPTYAKGYIADIQRRLVRLGYSVGKAGADDSKGPATDKAIRAFQKKYGLTQDALPGPATLSALKRVEVQKVLRAAQDNSAGPDSKKRANAVRAASRWGGGRFPYGVAYAQQVVGTTADGSWGPKSIAAHDKTVDALQRALGIRRDGIYGPETDRNMKNLGF